MDCENDFDDENLIVILIASILIYDTSDLVNMIYFWIGICCCCGMNLGEQQTRIDYDSLNFEVIYCNFENPSDHFRWCE